MWRKLGQFILRFRYIIIFILLAITAFAAYETSKVQISYDFSKAIPLNNPKYKIYQEFRKQFGEDGNLLVIGVQTNQFFQAAKFNAYSKLVSDLKKLPGVDDIISVNSAIDLKKDSATERLRAEQIFPEGTLSQELIDSSARRFMQLPFYRGLLYNPDSNAYLMGVRINKDVLSNKSRDGIVRNIRYMADSFGVANNLQIYQSGLPLIRTELSIRVKREMKMFILMSALLSAFWASRTLAPTLVPDFNICRAITYLCLLSSDSAYRIISNENPNVRSTIRLVSLFSCILIVLVIVNSVTAKLT